jgi:serine/threonine protein phosphatase PrpC
MINYKTFDVRSIGASHVKSGKVCQDYALSSYGPNYALAVVCDGHGGDKYIRSERGSKMAAEVAKKAIKSLFGKENDSNKLLRKFEPDPYTTLKQLASYIIYNWREQAEKDLLKQPFSEAELLSLTDKDKQALLAENGWISAYGTTLIAVAYTNDFWFGFQIGDGKCVAISEKDEYSQPIPWDDKCFLNATTSLCDEKALERFRFFFSTENLPKAILVASDGVDDTFGTDEALHGFYKSVMQLFTEKPFNEAKTELQNFLPGLSAKGSKDDISIAGILSSKLKLSL